MVNLLKMVFPGLKYHRTIKHRVFFKTFCENFS